MRLPIMEELFSNVIEGFVATAEKAVREAQGRKTEELTKDLVGQLYTPVPITDYQEMLYDEIAKKVAASKTLMVRKEPNVYPVHLHVKNGDIVNANNNNRDESLPIIVRGAGEDIDNSYTEPCIQIKCFRHNGGGVMKSKQFLSFRVLNTDKTKSFDVFFDFSLVGDGIRLASGEPPGPSFWKSFFKGGCSSVLVSEEDMGFDYLTDPKDGSKSRLILPGRDVIEAGESVQFNLSSDVDEDVVLAYDIFLVLFEKRMR